MSIVSPLDNLVARTHRKPKIWISIVFVWEFLYDLYDALLAT